MWHGIARASGGERVVREDGRGTGIKERIRDVAAGEGWKLVQEGQCMSDGDCMCIQCEGLCIPCLRIYGSTLHAHSHCKR